MREDLTARFDRAMEAFETIRQGLVGAERAVAELRVSRRSRDRAMTVTVGPGRQLLDLRITDAALRPGNGDELARTITGLLAAAHAEMAEAVRAEYARRTGLNIDPAALTAANAPDAVRRLSREMFLA